MALIEMGLLTLILKALMLELVRGLQLSLMGMEQMLVEDRIRAELRETDVKFVRLDETAIVAVSHSFLSWSCLLILAGF